MSSSVGFSVAAVRSPFFAASFSRWLSIHPKVDYYHNWARLVIEKLVANFALRREEFIQEID